MVTMLDLNLDVVQVHGSSSDETPHDRLEMNMGEEGMALEETFRAQMENSGTSNSSIIINNSPEEAMTPPGDENSSNDQYNSIHSELIFNIFKNIDGRDRLITHELFPEKSEALELNLTPSMEVKRSQLSFGLSCGVEEDDAEETEAKIFRQKYEHHHQQQQQQQVKKRRGPRSRSSQYRGVTFYRRTGRWESHIWDCGKQVYLGGFDTAHAAARAYDRAAIRFRGIDADINFNLNDYDEEMKQMKNLSKEEFVQILRRQSTGFTRTSSKFRSPPQKPSGWNERIRSFMGKNLYEKSAMASPSPSPSPYYQRDSVLNSRILDSLHNLDLSLGISPPGTNPTRNSLLVKVNPSTTGSSSSSSSVQTFHGLPLARPSITTWPAISGLVSNCQGRSESGMELGDWKWKSKSNQNELSFPVAASSGFLSLEALPSAQKNNSFSHFYTASSSSSAAPPTRDNCYNFFLQKLV